MDLHFSSRLGPSRSGRLQATGRKPDRTPSANLVEVTDVGIFHLPFKQKTPSQADTFMAISVSTECTGSQGGGDFAGVSDGH